MEDSGQYLVNRQWLFKRPVMARTQILGHKWRPKTREPEFSPVWWRRLTTVLTFTWRLSTRYCPSLSSDLAKIIRKYYVHLETSATVKQLIERASPALLKNDGEILEAKQKMYASFCPSRGLGYMTVPEMLEKMHVNDLFHIFSVFSNVVHIL